MEKLQKFIAKPQLDIDRGIIVNSNTTAEFTNELKDVGQKIHQKLKKNRLHTYVETNKEDMLIKTEIIMDLPNGSILLFDETNGYIKPPYDVCTPEEALEIITAKKDVVDRYEKGE